MPSAVVSINTNIDSFMWTGTAHMIEADVILPSDGSEHGQPIMAHPPEINSEKEDLIFDQTMSGKEYFLSKPQLEVVERQPAVRR